ncbi:UDP-N-acetylenolpyruvoylglucosamine reductase [Candidatus Entotheonellaceae bacterium PAL068K]
MDASSTRWDLPALLGPIPGRKRFHHPLARYTSFRIGGPADALVQIDAVQTLKQVQALARCHRIPLFMLGGGSNLLIRDGGIRGIVVLLRGAFRTYHVVPASTPLPADRALVHAGVAYSLSRLAMQLAKQGWSGLEFAYGIPGTLGGAMVMNAGTDLGDLSQVMVSARLLLREGQECEVPTQALGLRYRASSYPPSAIVLAGMMRLRRGDPEEMTAVMHASYTRRQRTQPLWLPNAGSIFKNPPGTAAARLIDALGLKGLRIGGAMVSPVHANFIVNVDHASAADVEALIAMLGERVQQACGIALELEVRVVGEEV